MRKGCCDKKITNKGAWSKQEDEKLIDYIRIHGHGSWRSLPLAAGLLRCGKSCRLRWTNYLRPDIKRGNFGEDEEDLIIKLHALLGNRWSLIAGRLPGRTDNEVKNYWNCHLRKKLINMGKIDHDPNINHRLQKQPDDNYDHDDDATSNSSSSSSSRSTAASAARVSTSRTHACELVKNSLQGDENVDVQLSNARNNLDSEDQYFENYEGTTALPTTNIDGADRSSK